MANAKHLSQLPVAQDTAFLKNNEEKEIYTTTHHQADNTKDMDAGENKQDKTEAV